MQTGESYKVRFECYGPRLGNSTRLRFWVNGVDKQNELVVVLLSESFGASRGRDKDPRAVAARAVRYYLENRVPQKQISQKEDHVELSVATYWYPGHPGCAEVEENWKEFQVAKLAKPQPRMGFIKDDNS